MSATPVVSISLPTRNRLALIQPVIQGIRAQSFTDWELIISDNASDVPGKADYLKQLAKSDPRIKLHLQPQNIGIHANWIFGIRQCTGRYYIAATDDDLWSGPDFLQQLLSMHDGKTGVVFPNLSVNRPKTGEFRKNVLTSVYHEGMPRHELCERMVKDRQGIIMMGLFDLQVVPKQELISVYEHGRHGLCETVGMVRIARNYPAKFCPSVSYVHTAYEGNYCHNCVPEFVLRDSGASTFLLLDELRLAAAKDPNYEPALDAQWQIAIRYCREVMENYEIKKGVITRRPKKIKGPLRTFISKKRKALKSLLKKPFQP